MITEKRSKKGLLYPHLDSLILAVFYTVKTSIFEDTLLSNFYNIVRFDTIEAHSEPRQIPMIEPFCENSQHFSSHKLFSRKVHFTLLTGYWMDLFIHLFKCSKNNFRVKLGFVSKSVINVIGYIWSGGWVPMLFLILVLIYLVLYFSIFIFWHILTYIT